MTKGRVYRRARRGFTLIELMIAITILTVITGIVYASFSTVITATETADEASQQLYTQSFLTRHLTDNITQAYAGWQAGAVYRPYSDQGTQITQVMPQQIYSFIGVDSGTDDTLTFSTSSPLSGATGLPGFFKQVTYELVDASDADLPEFSTSRGDAIEGPVLQVTEVPVMSYGDSLGGQIRADFHTQLKQRAERLEITTPVWVFPVDGMDIKYFDGEEWQDSWDMGIDERLPWAIDVTFIWRPWDEEAHSEDVEEDSFRMVLTIPGGAGIRNATPAYGRPERAL